jgi:hypothetical protein
VLDLGKEAPVIGSKVEGVPCPDLALLGPREMSDLSPQSGPKRTMIRVAVTNRDFMSTRPSVMGPVMSSLPE